MPKDPASPSLDVDLPQVENTIGPARRRTRADPVDQAVEPEARPVPIARPGDVPKAVARRYHGEPARSGDAIDYYEGRGAKQAAFQDRGDQLHAVRTDPSTVTTLLMIAKHRHWSTIEVRGDEAFRREVWRKAQTMGLRVHGYKPTARDREELEQAGGARREPSAPAAPAPSHAQPASREEDRWVVGKILEAGKAPYQHRRGAKTTPFLRLEQPDGRTVELWGVGLPAALSRAGAQVGDPIRIRQDGADRVTVTTEDRDPATGAVVRRQREVDRNRWVAEAERFRGADPKQRARDPTLAGAQSRLDVVNAVVRARIRDSDTRARVSVAAEARIANHIAAGRRFEPAPMGDRDRRGRDAGGPERARGR